MNLKWEITLNNVASSHPSNLIYLYHLAIFGHYEDVSGPYPVMQKRLG